MIQRKLKKRNKRKSKVITQSGGKISMNKAKRLGMKVW